MAKQIIPGPKSMGLMGSTNELRRDRLGFVMRMRRDYGDLVRFRFGPRIQAYMINDPELIAEVLVGQADKFEKGPRFKKNTAAMIGQGLLTSDGEFHKRQRKLVQPAFHSQRISGYAQTMVDYTLRHTEHWQDGAIFDMHEEMMSLTRDIVAKTLFNADVSDAGDQIAQAITYSLEATSRRAMNVLNPPRWLPTPDNTRGKEAVRVMNAMLTRVIDGHRASGSDQGDLLSMLLLAADEEGGKMTNQQARDEAMTLFIAGHETTANATSWTWFLLSQHPEVEAKLVAELDRVLGGRAPTMQDLANLPYTDQIIKESMRLYPPAWLLGLRLTIEDAQIGDIAIPKGSYVMISPYVMHRHPRYFAQPDQFIPERWTPEFEKGLPRFAYFPFGGGPRICIGNSFAVMESRLILATIAQRWHANLLPGQQIEPEPLVTLRPRKGIQMRVSVREPALTPA